MTTSEFVPGLGDVVRVNARRFMFGNRAIQPYYLIEVEAVLMEEIEPGYYLAVPTVEWEEWWREERGKYADPPADLSGFGYNVEDPTSNPLIEEVLEVRPG